MLNLGALRVFSVCPTMGQFLRTGSEPSTLDANGNPRQLPNPVAYWNRALIEAAQPLGLMELCLLVARIMG